jgi:hypothetical protein
LMWSILIIPSHVAQQFIQACSMLATG